MSFRQSLYIIGIEEISTATDLSSSLDSDTFSFLDPRPPPPTAAQVARAEAVAHAPEPTDGPDLLPNMQHDLHQYRTQLLPSPPSRTVPIWFYFCDR